MSSAYRDPAIADLVPQSAPSPAGVIRSAEERRAAIIVTLGFWAAYTAVQLLRSHLDGAANLERLLVARLVTAAFGLAVCYALHRVIVAMGERPFIRRASALLLLVPPAALACCLLNYEMMRLASTDFAAKPQDYGEFLNGVINWTWFLLAWAALYLALRYSFEIKAAELRARFIQQQAYAAQLRALQNQISPHFMFNTLNAISSLMLSGQVQQAEGMIVRLSAFLRSTLALDPLADITLAEELRIQLIYLDIERVRFPDMAVVIDVDDEYGGVLVPALLLQPILENAIKYAVAVSPGPTTIAISAAGADDRLVLVIEDDGHATSGSQTGLGVGLRNVAERLHARFGRAYGFSAGAVGAEGGYRVELSLPLRRAP